MIKSQSIKEFLYGSKSFAISGPNGIGKSCFIEGVVSEAINEKIIFSYFPQIKRQLYSLSKVLKILKRSGFQLVSNSKISNLIHRYNAENILKTSISNLSDGQIMIIQLIIAFSIETDIFILDEFTNGLDIDNKKITKNIVKEMMKNGKRFLICTHDKELLDSLNLKQIKLDKVGIHV